MRDQIRVGSDAGGNDPPSLINNPSSHDPAIIAYLTVAEIQPSAKSSDCNAIDFVFSSS